MRGRVFLFTDIQRSTRLWSEYTDEMASAISEHNRVLTDIVSHNQGEVLKNTGDGVLAMFDDGVTAISAAIDVQRWLDHRVWSSVGHLRVRMGLHTGEPILLDTGEITGPVINECARLHAAGHGGQILVSGRLAVTLVGRLPPGCSLKSLGQHTLPDLAPATIHQLCHPDLVADFPPLRTSVGSDLDLVGRSSSFHGRDRRARLPRSCRRTPALHTHRIWRRGQDEIGTDPARPTGRPPCRRRRGDRPQHDQHG